MINESKKQAYIPWVLRFIAIEMWIFTAKAMIGAILFFSQNMQTANMVFFGVPLFRSAWEYETMVASIYVVWAVYLWRAAKNPEQHISLINFTMWANLLHGVVMVIQTLIRVDEQTRLLFDSLSLLIPSLALLFLNPNFFIKKNRISL